MSEQKVMPTYQSIKKVGGLKIKAIALLEDGGGSIIPEEVGYEIFGVSKEYMDKHNPQVGGYYVVYKDGYESWSPAKAFEEGNVLIETAEYNTDLSMKDVSEDYQKRVCIEYDELHGKIRGLKAYLKNNTDELLKLQLGYMSNYAVVLGKRIEGFE